MFICNDCPRNCNAKREEYEGKGFCLCGEKLPVAKIMRHMWEEPVLTSGNGTENIFIYGCNLKCVFCQNYKINGTSKDFEKEKLTFYSPEEFRKILLDVNDSDADTIGIVTGDPYIRFLSEAITDELKNKLRKPLVFNFNGYAKPESLELLRGKIDVFMPDFKFYSEDTARSYSNAKDYAEKAKESIKKCFSIVGPCKINENNMLEKGVIIRHLILPGHVAETCQIIDWVNENFNENDVIFSLMSQYTPILSNEKVREDKLLSRTISKAEQKKAENYLSNAENITLCFSQEKSSSSEDFIPKF